MSDLTFIGAWVTMHRIHSQPDPAFLIIILIRQSPRTLTTLWQNVRDRRKWDSFDGDADRIGVVTGKAIFWGINLIIFARDILLGILGKIIGEVKCSEVLFEEVEKAGMSLYGK